MISPSSVRIGGIRHFAINLAQALTELGFDVFVVPPLGLVKDYTKQSSKAKSSKNSYLEFFSNSVRSPINSLSLIKYAWEGFAPDLIWADEGIARPSYLYLTLLKKGVKIITYVHMEDRWWMAKRGYWKKYSLSTFFVRLAMQKLMKMGNPFAYSNMVVTNSRFMANIIRYYYGSKPRILSPPIHVHDFNCSSEYEVREDSIAMVGRISREKRHILTIDAISKSKCKPSLVVAGALEREKLGYLKTLISHSKKLDVNLCVRTNLTKSQIVQILGESKAYIHAAEDEHFGISVIEAMAAGLPVIVHRSGGPYYDIINKGEYGLYFTNVPELTSAIDMLTRDKETWLHYSKLSRLRASQYDYSQFVRKLENLISEVLG